MKKHSSHQVWQTLKIAASFTLPADREQDDPREGVSTKPSVTVTVLGVLLMHVILVGAILACAGFSQSEPLHFISDHHVKGEVGGLRATSPIDTPNDP